MRKLFSLNFLYLTLIAAQVAAIVFLCLYVPRCLPVCLGWITVWLIDAIAAAVLFSRKGAPEARSAWFVVIASLPVAGAVIYFIATVKNKPCGILDVNAPAAAGNAAAAGALCGTAEVGYDRAVYYKDGAEFFNAVFSEIAKAKKRVFVEFYIIARGQTFGRFLNALEAARANGAEVKIILDGVGSAFKIGRREYKRLKKLGAEIKIFHRLTPLAFAKLNMRDHRKIVTVDGKCAFTGGINLADEYANLKRPYGFWKDDGVAVYGAAAKIFEGMFLSVWHKRREMQLPEGGTHKCLPYYDSPPYRTFCEDAYIRALSTAEKRVHILTPYFCPSEKTAAALAFTARRGVDVKVIIPHVPDKKIAFDVSKAFARELFKSGVKFYEYTPGFMHAKCLICDDGVFLGSYNFDFRSTHYNFECGVAFDGDITDDVELDFSECLALSLPLTEERIKPVTRLKHFLLRLFAPLM